MSTAMTYDSAAKAIEDNLTPTNDIGAAIEKALPKLQSLMPASVQDQAERFIKRALMYFARKTELQACSVSSKLRCVLDAAELGLALDGKLCHAVPYKREVECRPDYKGLIVVARRTGQITDVIADVVHKNDHFKHGRNGPVCHLEHTYDVESDRGDVTAAYAILKLPGGDWRYDLMSLKDLELIRSRSPARGSGPWVTDTDEMRKKTVIRRALKTYCDDPGVSKALELMDRDYGSDDGNWIPANNKMVRTSDLNRILGTNASDPSPAAPPEDDLPVFNQPPESREPGDDAGEEYLSDAALALEERLHGDSLDRQQNASILQDILANAALTDSERKHLRAIVENNAERLKAKK